MSGHNTPAKVQVTNNFMATAKSVAVHHRYSTSEDETHTWTNVAAASTTKPDMTVTYNISWHAFGHDTWWAEVELEDGTEYKSDQGNCTLHSGDKNAILTFQVDTNGFRVTSASNHNLCHWA